MDRINELRKKVTELDKQLLDILNQRGNVVQQIGDEKNKLKLNIHNQIREEEVIKQLKSLNSGPCNSQMIEEIYKVIFKVSKELQKQRIKRNPS
ncbi:chorismate mutase [Bacillus toyonensis]|uniref:chorismate mutase n=1 Tax=Bacillus toyonensis TaxID=155322 RepID=UPI003D1AC462